MAGGLDSAWAGSIDSLESATFVLEDALLGLPEGSHRLTLQRRLLLIRAWSGDWDGVARDASSTLLWAQGKGARVWLYRAWLEALRSQDDLEGLTDLARHLLGSWGGAEAHGELALGCLSLAGKLGLARKLLGELEPRPRWGRALALEMRATFYSQCKEPGLRARGVARLGRLWKAGLRNHYFPSRNVLLCSLENGAHRLAAQVYATLGEEIPCAPEPLWQEVLAALFDEQVPVAISLLERRVFSCPMDTDAGVTLAQCLYAEGHHGDALEVLGHLPPGDMDQEILLGMCNLHQWQTTGSEESRESARSALLAARDSSEALGVSSSAVVAALRLLDGPGPLSTTRGLAYVVEESTWRALLRERGVLLVCPRNVGAGDLLVFAVPEGGSLVVRGMAVAAVYGLLPMILPRFRPVILSANG